MQNITSTQLNQRDSKHLEELLSLTQLNYDDTSYQLSFNPFNNDFFPIHTLCDQTTSRNLSDLSVAQRPPHKQSFEDKLEEEEVPMVQRDVVAVLKQELNQQKNQQSQISDKKNKKRKQIKKPKKGKKVISQMPIEEQELHISEEAQMTTAPDEGIRDQNNCKSYHKLVKNYLQSKNCGQMIAKYEKKYHTRYYFVVALILIKYYVDKNFTQTYAKIVEKELIAQQKKIEKKIKEKEKLQKRIKQLKLVRGNTDELQMKRLKIDKQISHIEVVKYEINEFSMRSCATFFQGDIEESLKILYLKDDQVMRKRYYFDSALKFVKEIQAQVRKSSSRNS